MPSSRGWIFPTKSITIKLQSREHQALLEALNTPVCSRALNSSLHQALTLYVLYLYFQGQRSS